MKRERRLSAQPKKKLVWFGGSVLALLVVLGVAWRWLNVMPQVEIPSPQMPQPNGYDFFLRASRETEIHVLKRVFAVYRQHPGSAIARGADFNYAAHIIRRATGRWGLSSPNGESITPQQLSERLQHIHFSCGYPFS